MPVAVDVPELERRTLLKVRRHLYFYLMVGTIFLQIDKFNIGFAQLTMGKELGLKAAAFGLAASILYVSSLIMQVPAGLLFEKLGARRWLTGITIGWGLSCAAQAFVHNTAGLVSLRFLLGLFEAGFLPGMFNLVNIWFKGKNHGVAVSFTQIGGALAGVIGGPAAGWILGRVIFGLSGWRTLFLFEGGLTVLFGLVAVFIVSDDPGTARWLRPEERSFMTNYLSDYQVKKSAQGATEKTDLWNTLRDSRILVLTLSWFCAGWSAATVMYFMPTLLKAAGKGLSNQTVGYLTAIPFLVNVLVAFTWGAHGDKHNERRWHAVLPLLVALSGVILYPLAKSLSVTVLALVLVNAGNTGLYVGFWATCTSVLGRKTVAKSTAIIFSGSMLGQFIAPPVFGWAMDVTGTKTTGLIIWGGVLLLNFTVLNIFFLKYKAEQIITVSSDATTRSPRRLGAVN